MKRDQWEGGHRVPFIARWPGKIKADSVSYHTVSLTDVMSTSAAIVDVSLPQDAAEDSFNILPILRNGDEAEAVRRYTLQQTISLALSIRRGDWKYLDHQGSGGNNYQRPSLQRFAIVDSQPEAPGQLYNLAKDPGETINLYFEHPEIVKELKSQLDAFKRSGRSRP